MDYRGAKKQENGRRMCAELLHETKSQQTNLSFIQFLYKKNLQESELLNMLIQNQKEMY